MATKETAIESGVFREVVREVVSEVTSGGIVSFFKVIDTLAVKGIHCGEDELLTTLASLCPMVLAAEVSSGTETRITVRFTKV